MKKKVIAALIVATGVIALSGCTSLSVKAGPLVGVSLPASDEDRYTRAGDAMVEALQQDGYRAELSYADGDHEAQVDQLEQLIEDGAQALVVGAVNPSGLVEVVEAAKEKDIPVVAFERVLHGSDGVKVVVAHDAGSIGQKQAWSLLNSLGLTGLDGSPVEDAPEGPFAIELVAGPANDVQSALSWNGAMSALVPYLTSGTLFVGSGQTGFDQAQTPGGDAAVAKERITGILKKDGAPNAVLAANDTLAGAVISALRDADHDKKSWPAITGGGAELPSVKAIKNGAQYSTEFADPRALGTGAAAAVHALITGEKLKTVESAQFSNGIGLVPAYVVPTETVVADNLEEVIVESGYWSTGDIES